MDTLIEARNLSLRFSAPTEKKASLKKWVLDALRGRVRNRHFLALDDVSFRIDRGETVGLVGRNGAGKSTLLKLVTGIVDPTSGSISVRGQVAPLLALGNGLDPTLTGRENIYLNGAILGYEKAWLRAHEADIVAFSELGEFIDAPVRTVQELEQKSDLLKDFKAVKAGHVWMTGKYLYQATDIVGQLITDVHLMLTDGDPNDMTFLTKVE